MKEEIIKAVLTPEVIGTIFALVSGFLTFAATSTSKWLKSKIKDEKAQIAINTIDNIITDTVKEVETTMKKQMLEAAEDGKLSSDEKKALKANAKYAAINALKIEVIEASQALIPDLGKYVDSKIESIIFDIKKAVK